MRKQNDTGLGRPLTILFNLLAFAMGMCLILVSIIVLVVNVKEDSLRISGEIMLAVGVEVVSTAIIFFLARGLLYTPQEKLAEALLQEVRKEHEELTERITQKVFKIEERRKVEDTTVRFIQNTEEIKELFEFTGTDCVDEYYTHIARCQCLLEGHFELVSGKHSSRYIMFNRLLDDSTATEFFTQEIVRRLKKDNIKCTMVLGPSNTAGGRLAVVAGMELKKPARSIEVSRDKQELTLDPAVVRELQDQKCLYIDDLTTTGRGVLQVTKALQNQGIQIVAAVVVVFARDRVAFERLQNEFKFDGIPFVTLGYSKLERYTYEKEECKLCGLIHSKDVN